MTQVKWLIEPEVFQQDTEELVQSLEKLGVEHQICSFGRPYEEFIKVFKDEDCVVFYGSLQFAKIIKREAKWIPGVYCNLPKFECLYYYPRFGQHLLNSEYLMLPLGELKRHEKWIFDNVIANDKVFIRPSSGSKSFTGKVVKNSEWDKVLRELKFHNDPETLVIVASPANITHEWRIVVADNKVITASLYKENDKMVRSNKVPIEVLNYAQGVLDSVKYNPDFVWTLDICKAEDNFKVLEVGSFSCAGLYACDPELIINAVNHVALKEYDSYKIPLHGQNS